jgi:hypothetical protein
MKTSPSTPNSKFSYPLALNIQNLPAIAQVIEYSDFHTGEVQPALRAALLTPPNPLSQA